MVAYFSMEIGLSTHMPTYSGGLGILAGDTLKSFSDLHVPVVGITLLSKKGYFYQKLDEQGNQREQPAQWSVNDFLTLLPEKIAVEIEGRTVNVQIWEYVLAGIKGFEMPIYFLDTDIETNAPEDREITSYLYGGDIKYRIKQEIVLGIGGVKLLRELKFSNIKRYHMNEGHSAFLVCELYNELKDSGLDIDAMLKKIREQCVFTTHTPIAAGHDIFPMELALSMVGKNAGQCISRLGSVNGNVNMTLLALNACHYVNGVAKKHGEVTQQMFPGYPIDSITNGVHSSTWVSDSLKLVFNRHIPGWENDPSSLRYAMGIPKDELKEAHFKEKKKLIDFVNSETNAGMDYDFFTIGFGRRMTAYKRSDLLFSDIKRLLDINGRVGKIQIIFAGKAHPADQQGKDIIRNLFNIIGQLKGRVNIAYLENYDMDIAKLLVAGVDVWLNTPQRPLEASGTSGMKACHNGVPHFSVLDGWWLEGHIEGVTGWSIGPEFAPEDSNVDANDLYEKLEKVIVPLFYNNYDQYLSVMQKAIAINASFFNTHRMVQQYVLNAYFQ
ncbi:MAG: alpha-glucan family phosphorylase [Candidatus Woesearchaeota archaeon]